MKIKTNIARLLAIGVLLNNIYLDSNANSIDILDRYETLNDEYITINNSEDTLIKDLEIVGNSIQDENNVENLHSVGDLYVDENGSPILDSQGREQYKIDIVIKSKNLFDSAAIIPGSLININNEVSANASWFYTDYIKVEKGTYSMGDYKKPFDNYYCHFYDLDKNHIGNGVNVGFTTNGLCTFSQDGYIRLSGVLAELNLGQLEEGSISTEYTPFKEEKLTILLPYKLEKTGNIVDRIIKKNGVWGIEKNTETYVLNGDEPWIESTKTKEKTLTFRLANFTKNTSALCNKFYYNNESYTTLDSEGFKIPSDNYLYINILRSRLDTEDLAGFKKWVSNNNITVLSTASQPRFIPLSNSEQDKLNSFIGDKYIFGYSENGVNPIIKITIDKINIIAKENVANVEAVTTSENLSLARCAVNKMEESLLKDQLQARLNDLSDFDDLQLEKLTATSNLDVYIKSDSMLSLSLNTNSVSFNDYSGVADMELKNAIELSVNSSLPYDINAYMPVEISNSDGSRKMDLDLFNIKESNEVNYQQFASTTDKLILKNDCAGGNDNLHLIDLKLSSNQANKADVYKTTIKFEVVQK